ncbi:hypothetical protein GH714_017912 [Hevea brasiliensis]|uniref:DUF4219 domain-containing protein n=1 Tax=Hevea brasiliensis TaxID=3981 RepID=A0A6A6KQQ2_HEVBR|nr:hypothetical protein GH714_017912 [Hevea brasiliensis]
MESLLCKPQQDMKRLEKFNGMNYKCWSMKIMYQLTATKVLYVLNTPYPQDGTSEGQLSEAQQKWVEDDFVCHSMILNAISNALFNVFHKCYPAYELWATIELSYANWASDRRSSKSTSGWLFTIGGAIVSWSSKKQSCVALPSMESEFIAMSLASRDILWIKRFMSKHIAMRYNHVRSLVKKGKVSIEYLLTDQMVADPLTKPLSGEKIKKVMGNMGLSPV